MRKGLTYINGHVRKEYMQDYYRKNRERINARVTEYCKNHAEERKAKRKQRYQENRELQLRRVRICKNARNKRKVNVWWIDKKIEECKTERSKQKLLRKRERAIQYQKDEIQRIWDIRMEKRRNLREAKIQAKIDAWKDEVLNSKNIPDENKTTSEELPA